MFFLWCALATEVWEKSVRLSIPFIFSISLPPCHWTLASSVETYLSSHFIIRLSRSLQWFRALQSCWARTALEWNYFFKRTLALVKCKVFLFVLECLSSLCAFPDSFVFLGERSSASTVWGLQELKEPLLCASKLFETSSSKIGCCDVAGYSRPLLCAPKHFFPGRHKPLVQVSPNVFDSQFQRLLCSWPVFSWLPWRFSASSGLR